MAIKGQSFLKAALLVVVGAGLSGCVYDVGLGFASDGYYDDAYGCDPYGGYDAYYNCDYAQAFSNIGFGGGWYDNYYYPGYGISLFDNFGRRYPMREQYRRYWGERRHSWYREHHGREDDGGRYQARGRDYTDNATPRAIGSPEGNSGRVRDADGRGGSGDGQRGDRQGRSRGRSHDDDADAVRGPQQGQAGVSKGARGERPRGDGEARGYRQPSAEPSTGQVEAPVYRPASQPRAESGRQQTPRQRMNEGAPEQPE